MSWEKGHEAEKSVEHEASSNESRKHTERPTAIAIEDDGTLERLLSESPQISAKELRKMRESGDISEEEKHFIEHATIANISFAFDIRAVTRNSNPQAAFEELVNELACVILDTIRAQDPNAELVYKKSAT